MVVSTVYIPSRLKVVVVAVAAIAPISAIAHADLTAGSVPLAIISRGLLLVICTALVSRDSANYQQGQEELFVDQHSCALQ